MVRGKKGRVKIEFAYEQNTKEIINVNDAMSHEFYTCIDCEQDLFPAKGEKRRFHYKHRQKSPRCSIDPLHFNTQVLILSILRDRIKNSLPYFISFPCLCGDKHRLDILSDADSVEMEYWIIKGNKRIRPDIAILREGEAIWVIEVVYHNPLPDETRGYMEKWGLGIIEIVINEELYKGWDIQTDNLPVVFDATLPKSIKTRYDGEDLTYISYYDRLKDDIEIGTRICDKYVEKKIYSMSQGNQIFNCPRGAREIDDFRVTCEKCEYQIELNEYVKCVEPRDIFQEYNTASDERNVTYRIYTRSGGQFREANLNQEELDEYEPLAFFTYPQRYGTDGVDFMDGKWRTHEDIIEIRKLELEKKLVRRINFSDQMDISIKKLIKYYRSRIRVAVRYVEVEFFHEREVKYLSDLYKYLDKIPSIDADMNSFKWFWKEIMEDTPQSYFVEEAINDEVEPYLIEGLLVYEIKEKPIIKEEVEDVQPSLIKPGERKDYSETIIDVPRKTKSNKRRREKESFLTYKKHISGDHKILVDYINAWDKCNVTISHCICDKDDYLTIFKRDTKWAEARVINGVEIPTIINNRREIAIIDNSISSVKKIIRKLIGDKQRGILVDLKRDSVLNINSNCTVGNYEVKLKKIRREKGAGIILYDWIRLGSN